MSSLMSSFMGNNDKEEHDTNFVYSNDIMTDMISSMYGGVTTNNLMNFKKYIEDNSIINDYTNDIKYKYNLDLNIYNKDLLKINPSEIMNMFGFNSQFSNNVDVFIELTDNKKLLNNEYEIVSGRLPSEYNELVLIIDDKNEINDYVLYSLGLKDQKEIQETMQKMQKGEEIQEFESTKYSYEDILKLEYKLILNTDYYKKENGVWVDKSKDIEYLSNLVNSGIDLKIVGIIKPTTDSNVNLNNGVGYTSNLTKFVVDKINESNIAKEQLSNKNINVFTNQEFTNLDTYENNLRILGVVDLNNPDGIEIYPNSFESKDEIIKYIDKYNKSLKKEGKEKLEYTDYVGMLMKSVTTIVNVIVYVLIAFVSISLIVSSIMIGIITYTSVLERTKEIGILRSIGASKKDISRVFNAETFIVGLASGIIGILITIILNLVINVFIKKITGVVVTASLPFVGAVVLIIISILLTVIAGLIPSKVASKKDPVIALRTE